MTKEETISLMEFMADGWPNFYRGKTPEEAKRAATLWSVALAEYDAACIMCGLKTLLQTKVYPPTVAEVISCAKAEAPDPMDIGAREDAEYRRLNPAWAKTSSTRYERALWLEAQKCIGGGK